MAVAWIGLYYGDLEEDSSNDFKQKKLESSGHTFNQILAAISLNVQLTIFLSTT
jgi:hypothetical protein